MQEIVSECGFGGGPPQNIHQRQISIFVDRRLDRFCFLVDHREPAQCREFRSYQVTGNTTISTAQRIAARFPK